LKKAFLELILKEDKRLLRQSCLYEEERCRLQGKFYQTAP